MRIVSRQPSESGPARIAALSVLPVFLDLAGKRAVVAGGGAAAAWKAELLAAVGAEVHVYADTLCAEMRGLVEGKAAVFHHPRVWSASCFAGAAIAVADARDDAEAAAFEKAARDAAVLCNVIDRPAFCHFQFGSIVNRSPVVVGISTSGAAPILAQTIRRKIETLLPPALADWAALAERMRDRVMARLSHGAERRGFWERFVDFAFGPAPNAVLEAALGNMIEPGAPLKAAGHVTFVGAGPGDAELLTIKAVRALQSADTILFDTSVSGDVLELARREAKRIAVGDRAAQVGGKSQNTGEILVDLARSGQHIVRVVSGHPILGRAGAEIAELEKAGIGYDVVPGIAASVAFDPQAMGHRRTRVPVTAGASSRRSSAARR
jgi:uroporphyrin-III C-methyltransferase/precorrin-2 dehydrogenase/sirohydrochlorin ferrochelatase